MSWSSRFGQWSGRFSPFGRSPSSAEPHTVSDGDFSYITSDDLRRQQKEQEQQHAKYDSAHHSPSPPPGSGSKDTDVLILKNRRVQYPVHFPIYSIDRGELTVGDIRVAAAKKLSLAPSEAKRIKLFYRGRNMKDDEQRALDEGLRSTAEILCVIGEMPPPIEGDEESEEDGVDDGLDGEENDISLDPSKPKRKRNRNRKKKGRRTGGADNTPDEHSGTSTPQIFVQKAPQTPMEKLEALASNFHTTFVPQCVQFTASPPADDAKRQFEHKRLTEMILAQVLLKLDAVETEGDSAARARRKEIVKEVQSMLTRLDAVLK